MVLWWPVPTEPSLLAPPAKGLDRFMKKPCWIWVF